MEALRQSIRGIKHRHRHAFTRSSPTEPSKMKRRIVDTQIEAQLHTKRLTCHGTSPRSGCGAAALSGFKYTPVRTGVKALSGFEAVEDGVELLDAAGGGS